MASSLGYSFLKSLWYDNGTKHISEILPLSSAARLAHMFTTNAIDKVQCLKVIMRATSLILANGSHEVHCNLILMEKDGICLILQNQNFKRK